MAKNANSTSTLIASRRRLGAGLLSVIGGSVLTSGIAAGTAASVGDVVPSDTDAELIAACDQFCELERDYDVACRLDDKDGTDARTSKIVAMSDTLAERMLAMPCNTLAGVRALAQALAAWDRELLTDAPAHDMGELITSHLVSRLLALPSGGA